MNERERAEIVARAIDALLSGAHTNTSEKSGKDELQSLLRIAEERLLGSMFIAKASLQHEREIWKSVVKRIQDAEIEAVAADSDTQDEDLDELAEVIAIRRRMAAEVSALGEGHRGEVWAKIHSRLLQRTQHTRVPKFFRRFRRRSDATPSSETPILQTYIPKSLLLPGVHTPPTMGQMAESTQEMARARVWARLATGAGLDDVHIEVKTRRRRLPTLSRVALAAAAVAIVALALGPLPTTGFADHPAIRLATVIGDYVGAQEASPPALTRLPPPTLVKGSEATTGEASALAGVTFREPVRAPDGFEFNSSTYLPEAIAGNGAGTFVLAYDSADARLTIYQEAAGGRDSAVAASAMTGVALSDGTPATLVQGSWLSSEGLSWSDWRSQSLIFERTGVLVVIELYSVSPRPKLLFGVAESIQ